MHIHTVKAEKKSGELKKEDQLAWKIAELAAQAKNVPLQDDVKELTEAQRQAAYTIATVKAAEQELRRHAPGPYWYSNPEALNPIIAGRPQSAAATPLPRRAPSSPSPAR